MSKGEIIEHIGEGQYRVRQKLAVDRIQQELTRLNARIADLAVDLPNKKADLLIAQDAVNDKIQEINLKIPDLQDGVEGARKEIALLQRQMIQLQSKVRTLEIEVSELIAENLAALKRRSQLEAVPDGRNIDVWCADYSPDLSGEVGLVDINDEGGQGALIQPGFTDGALYSPARDGALFPNLAQTAAQVYFNAAILPGVQKWQPRYRIGTISNIVNDVGTVTLDAATSSAQSLNINQADVLADVPIQYMDCNGIVFENGDKVVVRFFDSGPQVVGFFSNPKPCFITGFAFIPAKFDPLFVEPVTFGKPFFDSEGNPINPNLGTQSSIERMWVAGYRASSNQYAYNKGIAPQYGNMNWKGPDKIVLSWSGPGSRLFQFESASARGTSTGWREQWNLSSKVYHKNQTLVDFGAGLQNGNDLVIGAAIHNSALLVVTVNDVFSPATFALYRFAIDSRISQATDPNLITTYTPPESETIFRSGFYFSESGAAGVCSLMSDDFSKVYALRASEAGGFARELVYDAYSGSAVQSYRDTTCDYDITRDGSNRITNATWDETIITYYPSTDVPVCFDFRGETEITVFHSRPYETVTDISSGTYVADGTDINSTRTRTVNVVGTEKITTSEGDILAEIIVPRSLTYNLSVSPVGTGSNSRVEYNDGYDERLFMNFRVPVFDFLCVNARDKVCAVAFNLREYSGSGINADASRQSSSSGSNFFEISDYSGLSTITRRIEVFSKGAKLSSQDMPESLSGVSGAILSERVWFVPEYLDGSTGSGQYLNTQTFDFAHTLIENSDNHPELLDFGGVEHSGKVAVSLAYEDASGFKGYQFIESVGDPVSTIFGKQAGEPYVMHRLSLA